MRAYSPPTLLNILLDTTNYFVGDSPGFVISRHNDGFFVHDYIWDETRYRIATLNSEEHAVYQQSANTLRGSLPLEQRCLVDSLFPDRIDSIKEDVIDCLAANKPCLSGFHTLLLDVVGRE